VNCTITQQNIVGTYPYMAPEMFMPVLGYTSADIYSLQLNGLIPVVEDWHSKVALFKGI